jgi:ribosomal protein S18 acetylase RimI-like enzyme
VTNDEDVRFRVAAPADAANLLPLFKAFYREYFELETLDDVRRQMRTTAAFDTVVLASARGGPAGFASLRLLPQLETRRVHAELSDIYVDPAYRRLGVGRGLTRFAEGLARDHGSTRMHLITGLDDEGATAFYEALGYRGFGRAMSKELGGRT